ncbi:intradiol ring-cleavage dioxygenase [Coniophora puteana RWD-64-598 SS2]|uniref:Intradiol ring-cleavage dioxygenase n=1 Tax=Coniophora puteana (strain RWD-64-598) TaxID=741705 RepID=A0A5M3N0G6_CONPW|nr:intradiol ring-cleavage dioxygenase [Coniophora puteana RWD-64-598 SS2]EIW84737.1 intradiol ring-cleavage dioxygenase [Coniophora puteana RWD-64-598 SS2]
MADASSTAKYEALHNGIEPPSFKLPLIDNPEIVTANTLKLVEQTPDARKRFLFTTLTRYLHDFIKETKPTTEEWHGTLKFLSRAGQLSTPDRQEMELILDIFGAEALIDTINNPPKDSVTERALLGPFFTEHTHDVSNGDSIASEGKGEYMYVDGRVVDTEGKPIANAVVDAWEADDTGHYDLQYDNGVPDCRGRLRTDAEGKFNFRAIVPIAYPLLSDGPLGELLLAMNRHNMRPSHLHIIVDAPGYEKLVTQFYPSEDKWIDSDSVLGVKKSLVVDLEQVNDVESAKALGFQHPERGFKLFKRDIVMRRKVDA